MLDYHGKEMTHSLQEKGRFRWWEGNRPGTREGERPGGRSDRNLERTGIWSELLC